MSNFNKVKCSMCGELISTANIKKHIKSHEVGTYEKNRKQRYKLDHDDLFCKFCNKECKNKNSLIQHEIRCNENPNNLNNDGNVVALRRYGLEHHATRGKSYSDFEKWKTDQSLVCQYCGRSQTQDLRPFSSLYGLKRHEISCRYNPSKIIENPNHVSSLEKELDDDGKLFTKYSMKRSNAKTMGNEFHLTLHEFCTLMKEAGLKSSNLGLNGNHYDLARYGDTGPYEIGNCRFITHQENVKECESGRSKLPKFIRLGQEALKRDRLENPEKYRKIYRDRVVYSEYFKRRKEEAAKREAERRSNLDPRYTGEHNSQLGTHWITNGEINKKLHPGDEMPEGFYFGRVNGNQYRSS